MVCYVKYVEPRRLLFPGAKNCQSRAPGLCGPAEAPVSWDVAESGTGTDGGSLMGPGNNDLGKPSEKCKDASIVPGKSMRKV
jgi:hypothetical protein